MAKLLRRCGHSVVVASSCAEGLAMAAVHHFDFVISDLGLPDGSGQGLMRSLRSLYGLSGIAVSALNSEDCIEEPVANGFARHFVKPIEIRRVQEALIELDAASHNDSIRADSDTGIRSQNPR